MNRKKLILIIVGAVIGVGLIFGYGYGLGIRRAEIETPSGVPLLDLIEAGVIENVTAAISGKVTEILDRTLIVVTDNNQTVNVPIKEEAGIESFIFPDVLGEIVEGMELVPERKELKFEDIKKNDRVDILIQVKITGEIEGISVTVLPLLIQN